MVMIENVVLRHIFREDVGFIILGLSYVRKRLTGARVRMIKGR